MHQVPMISSKLFGVAMMTYIVATLCYLAFMAFKNKKVGMLATGILILGFLVHTVGIALRWRETHLTGYGYVPLSNMYESLIFFSWTMILIYLIFEWRYKRKVIGVFFVPLAFLAIAATSIIPGVSDKIRPLIPALQSNWLTIHVTTCFFGYAAFAAAFVVSLLYLLQYKRKSTGKPISWLPEARVLDDANYKSIIIGFPMLTIGIITGAMWANYAWGSYWSWDPKETWSLITWFIYAAFLHARYTRGWHGRKAAFLSVIGFVAVLFTYFGVNYLISGLHSYAS
jgi:cytochrome c-type biogenesis protein CcsB